MLVRCSETEVNRKRMMYVYMPLGLFVGLHRLSIYLISRDGRRSWRALIRRALSVTVGICFQSGFLSEVHWLCLGSTKDNITPTC